MTRYRNPFIHTPALNAMDVLIKSKAERIDKLAEDLLIKSDDTTGPSLLLIKQKALEIVSIIEKQAKET